MKYSVVQERRSNTLKTQSRSFKPIKQFITRQNTQTMESRTVSYCHSLARNCMSGQAARLIFSYWGTEFQPRVVEGTIVVMGNVGIFFLGACFLNFIPPTLSTFQSPFFISLSILLHSSFTSSIVMKNTLFGAPPVHNHPIGERRSKACILCSSIGLRALANIVYDRMGREWLITNLRLRAQPSTGEISPGGSAGGGGTAMNGPANMGMTLQSSFHITHSPY